MTETIEIELKVTAERANGLVLGDLIAAQEGDLKAMRNTLAHFVVNGTGDYMNQEDYEVTLNGEKQMKSGARTRIGQLTLGRLKVYSNQLQGNLREDAVPKENGTDSEPPSDTG